MTSRQSHWSEAIKLLPIVNRCKTTENNLKDMLTIYSSCYVAFITYQQLPEINFKFCTNEISKILAEAHKTNTNLFLELMNDLLGSNKNFRILLWKHLDGTDSLIRSLTGMLQNCKNVNNINEFNENNCANCLFLINMDVKNKTKYSLLYVKAWMAAIKNTNDQNAAGVITKLLTLVYFLIKVVSDGSLEQFEVYLIDVLQKLTRILQTQSYTAPWCIFSAVIACNTIFRYCFEFSKKLKKECVDPMHDMLEALFEIVQLANSEASWGKKYCLDCDDYVPHLKWSLCHLSAFNLRKSIQLEVKNDKFGKLFEKILENAMQTQIKSTCRELKGTVEHALWECCNFITSSIQSKMFVDIAYRSLVTWRRVESIRDHLKPSQVVHFFKHLLKLNGRFREAIEMQCLHIVHLLNNPETKRLTVLDEIAVCCSNYKDAKVSFETSICDILDKANFDMEMPAYDRKLVKRLQLQATTTYAGIDPSFKVALAKKIIMETYDEVELAHIVKAIGKLSFPELEAKVQSSVESLKRKILVEKDDHQKQLALGRLLTCHYKFILERKKGMTGKKYFKENTFHEIELEELKKFDIYSENSMLEVLVTARECFEQFFSKADLVPSDFDWNDIIDDVSLLARHFTLRGYLDHGYNSWILIFKIADRHKLPLNKIRSVSFFAEYSNVIENIDNAIDLPSVINSVSEDLISHYQELDKYSPRQQNYILLAILNIASYYSRQKDLKNAHMLAELVRDARSKLKNRENSSELISIYLLAFNFNMISCLSEEKVANSASPYSYIHGILDAIANAKYVTSEDSINMPTFLFRLIVDMTSFTLSRLCSPPIRPLLFSILNWMEDFTLGLRMAQIVLLLAAVDLQMERIDNFQAKVTILSTLLAKQPRTFLRKNCSEKPKSTFLTEEIIDMYDLAVEPARRVPLSPMNIQRQPYIQSDKTASSEYLLEHPNQCTCHFCLNPPFQMIGFELACLLAQDHYINGDYLDSESVLLQSLNWWKKKVKQPSLECMWFDSIFRMLVLYINTCRQMSMFDKTLQAIAEARAFLKKYGKDSDESYAAILAETELCILDLQRSHETSEEMIQKQQPASTELKTPKPNKSRIKPLNIVTVSLSRKNMPSHIASNGNDLNIVTDLISDWNLSDNEGKENIPIFKKKSKTEVKVPTTSRTGKAARKKVCNDSISPEPLPNPPASSSKNGIDKVEKDVEIVEVDNVNSLKSKSGSNRRECKLKNEIDNITTTQRRGRKKIAEQTDPAANIRKITTRRRQC
ncbi:uncharacterized protein LOC119647002 [Hermetia illucens]|uniref:uncharacterized protein LOC119647002 n=1 Tax=Hermetia illucens TaxID=343691 RepID=UPI0018CC0D7F|nr:uncharacterized protein LOC119647002 [Hermetia illucens]